MKADCTRGGRTRSGTHHLEAGSERRGSRAGSRESLSVPLTGNPALFVSGDDDAEVDVL
ncbi:hypothetical protein E3U43_010720 [Larimichthys crocea]|uniref:Uncharacterized protein n=1 Tax=Larimichthys crocea TaxID=215358 RepID=A0ACD3RI81_LARCR|nr:hypothetical protein E3U43_005376 [Larimichthys crocea]TMS18394.1 hypothetical protein E3U43_010720 [Larimichthys crocea]